MIHWQWLTRIEVESSKAGPPIILSRTNQARLDRISMNVIDLLPDHPAAPQGHSLKALLPDFMCKAISSLKSFIVTYRDDFSRCNTFERTGESLDIAIAWIK